MTIFFFYSYHNIKTKYNTRNYYWMTNLVIENEQKFLPKLKFSARTGGGHKKEGSSRARLNLGVMH
jgi:hypothetical protein